MAFRNLRNRRHKNTVLDSYGGFPTMREYLEWNSGYGFHFVRDRRNGAYPPEPTAAQRRRSEREAARIRAITHRSDVPYDDDLPF